MKAAGGLGAASASKVSTVHAGHKAKLYQLTVGFIMTPKASCARLQHTDLTCVLLTLVCRLSGYSTVANSQLSGRLAACGLAL